MRIAVISDIHANLPALEAVLAQIKPLAADLVLSLGDQINLGPQPCEVLALLRAQGIPILLGNHELRHNHLLSGRDPALAHDVNFASVRRTQALLGDAPIKAPFSHSIENITFAHSAPDDPFFAVYRTDLLPAMIQSMPTPILICGHDHSQWSYTLDGRSLHVVGAVGMAENRLPGTAQFALVEISKGGVRIEHRHALYNPAPLRDAFMQNGFVDACPIMARLCYEAMRLNECLLPGFVTDAFARARAQGHTHITKTAWHSAARAFHWRFPDPWLAN